MCVDITNNELAYLECIHLFVEILDHFFSNVYELDLVFNFHMVYLILDEFVLVGELQETSKKVCDTVFRILISQPYQTKCLCPDINLRVYSRIGRLVLPKAWISDIDILQHLVTLCWLLVRHIFPPISQPEGLLLRIQDVKGKEWVFLFRFWPNNNRRINIQQARP